MRNFNTNQTRHFYVAGAINANVGKDRNAADTAAAANLDIALKKTATGELYFVYKNGDGIITRSDSFAASKIKSFNKVSADAMATPLMMRELQYDPNKLQLGAALIGESIILNITFHGLFDYDMDNSSTIVASVVGDSVNTASASAFYKAMAVAIAQVMPKNDPKFPLLKIFCGNTEVKADTKVADITGNINKIVLVQGAQKYVRGKLTGEPVAFSVASKYAPSNVDQHDWLTDDSYELKKSNVAGNLVVPANYILADLERFALGERGDMYREFNYPNNYEVTYGVSLDPAVKYNVLSIEYYWNGNAENIQKSPRLIQVAAPASEQNDIVGALYNIIAAAQ